MQRRSANEDEGVPDLHHNVSTNQKAWISENLIAMEIMLQSKGRLSPCVPLTDDHGIDLVIFDKITAETVGLQVKVWTKAPSKQGTIQFDTRKATFTAKPRIHYVMVYVPFPSLQIEYVWWIPSINLPTVAHDKKGSFALSCSVKPNSSDRASKYRYDRLGFMAPLGAQFAG